jgi:hypothetical protein
MSAMIVAALLALALADGSAISPPHAAAASNIFDDARARQTFYPVGSLQGDGLKMAYYLMGGRLSDRGLSAARSAVLVNLTADRGLVQVVELQTVSCADGRLTPTFRMMFDSDGDALPSSGPVQEQDQARDTLLSPEAARQTVEILCRGVEPKNALTGRTLIEVR